jgi:hypothetical protein
MFPELLGWQANRAGPLQGKEAPLYSPLEDTGIFFGVRRSFILVGCIRRQAL